MGPEATIDFMARVLALTPAASDQDHLRLLIDQNPRVPDRQAAISAGGGDPAPALAAMARGLEAQGADFLVMPCNAAHAYVDEIRAAASIPLVSIVDASLDAVAGYACVGVVATKGALAARLYQSELERRGQDFVVPDDGNAEEVNRLVAEVKAGNRSEAVAAGLRAQCAAVIAKGADVIVGACTEIPLVIADGDLDVPFVSTTEELARRTVALSLGESALPDR